jgi:hypothetical protein
MGDPAMHLIAHMKATIGEMRALSSDESFDRIGKDVVARAAFERYLSRLSVASRNVLRSWMTKCGPDVASDRLADIVDMLRDYRQVDVPMLRRIWDTDLLQLERAVECMVASHGTERW